MAKCSLCLKEKTLEESHLIPKSIYKAIRNSFPETKGGITFGSVEKKSINYSDYQVKQPFLCFDCEQKFSKYGENYVTPDCFREKNNFSLLKKINEIEPKLITEDHKWYVPESSEKINKEAYLYFGTSVFWRASAGKWKNGIARYYNALGDKYQEKIRQYLVGESVFPQNVYLAVYVDSDKEILPLTIFPTVINKNGYHHHVFYVPGIKFSLIVGNNVSDVKELSHYLKSKVLFTKYSFKKHPDCRLFCKILQTVKPRGRFEKELLNPQ